MPLFRLRAKLVRIGHDRLQNRACSIGNLETAVTVQIASDGAAPERLLFPFASEGLVVRISDSHIPAGRVLRPVRREDMKDPAGLSAGVWVRCDVRRHQNLEQIIAIDVGDFWRRPDGVGSLNFFFGSTRLAIHENPGSAGPTVIDHLRSTIPVYIKDDGGTVHAIRTAIACICRASDDVPALVKPHDIPIAIQRINASFIPRLPGNRELTTRVSPPTPTMMSISPSPFTSENAGAVVTEVVL